jgi:hypothetical protein
MANQIKFKRGLQAQRTSVTPAQGEPIYTTDDKKFYIGDGVTPGGVEVAPNATHTGDVSGATVLTIANDAVNNAKLANMATKTYKGRTSAATGDPEDVPVATLKADLALVKSDVGLGNVDNVQQIPLSQKGAVNGVAELDATGKVPSTQLPSFVDDVLEFANLAAFPATGESGKIYIALDSNKTYRWSGTVYVVISDTIALGETDTTAYRGDRGKIAYDHSQVVHAPSNADNTAANQTSHADVVVDGDFPSQGLMRRGASAGVYSVVPDNSSNWNTAFGWGNHSGLYLGATAVVDGGTF